MFDIFGNMDSVEELNQTAAGLKAENDIENLKRLAEENGIAVEMAELYAEDALPAFTDAMSAAIGKLEIEGAELKPVEIMADWLEYIKCRCWESVEVATAVRKKDKSLKECMGYLLKWSHDNMKDVDGDIKKAAGFSENVKMGIPGMGRAKKLITEYYLGK